MDTGLLEHNLLYASSNKTKESSISSQLNNKQKILKSCYLLLDCYFKLNFMFYTLPLVTLSPLSFVNMTVNVIQSSQ